MTGIGFALTITLGIIVFAIWCHWPTKAGDQEQ